MRAEINGTELHYRIEGRPGAPWITFSHALANDLGVWEEIAAALADEFRILRFDLRGHGASKATPGPYDFALLIDDCIGLLDHLDIAATHWVGLSIGGMLGYGLAIEHPARLLSLAACASRADAPPDYAAYFQSRIDKTRDAGMAGVVDTTIERWFTPEACEAQTPRLLRVRASVLATDPVGHAGCCEALKRLSYGARLSEIALPVLVAGGAADKGAPPEILAEVAAAIPGARHVVIPNSGHIIPAENPRALIDALRDFLPR